MTQTITETLSIDALTSLVTQSLAGTTDAETTALFARSLQRFLDEHGAYCGGYLLLHLGMARRMWDRTGLPGTPYTPAVEGNVVVEIDLINDSLMDLTIVIPAPDNAPLPTYFFEQWYASAERAIYLRFQK